MSADVLGQAWVAIQADVADALRELDVFRVDAEKISPVITPVVNAAAARAEMDGLTASEDRAAAGARGVGAASTEAGTESRAAFSGIMETIKPLLVMFGAFEAFEGIKKSADDLKEFQTRLVDLQTGAGESAANLDMVRSSVLSMSSELGVSAINLEKGLYYIESAGYHGAEGLNVLKAAEEGARVGMAPVADVANALTTALTDYNIPAKNATATTSELVATVAQGKTRMADLSGALSTILPIASSLHIPLTEVLGAMAQMTSHGLGAANAATYLRGMLSQLIKPSQNAASAMDEVHLTADQVATSLGTEGLIATMKMIEDHIDQKFKPGSAEAVSSLAAIVGGQKGLQAALQLTGNGLDAWTIKAQNVADAAAKGNKEVDGWSAMTKTFGFQVDRTKAQMQAWGIEIGTALLPAITGISRIINDDVLPSIDHLASDITSSVGPAIHQIPQEIADTFPGLGQKIAGYAASVESGAKTLAGGILSGIKTGFTTGQWKPLGDALAAGIGQAINAIGNDGAKLGNDIIRLIGEIPWLKIAYAVGDALASALSAGQQIAVELASAITKLLGKIDWISIGLDVGKYIPEIMIGLAAGIANFDPGKLFGDIFHNLPAILIAALTVALAPEELLGRFSLMLDKVPLIGPLLRWVFDGFARLSKGLGGVIGEVFKAIGRGIAEAVGRDLPDISGTLSGWLGSALDGVYRLAAEAGSKITDGLEAAGRWIGSHGPKQIGDGLASVKNSITSWASSAGTWLEQAGTDLMGGFKYYVQQGWSGFVSVLGTIKAGIVESFLSAKDWLANAGGDLLRGLANGVHSSWRYLVGFLGDIYDEIVKQWGAPAGNWLVKTGSDLLSGLANGVKAGWRYLTGFLADIYNAIQQWADPAVNWLDKAGGNIILGLRNGAKSAWHWLDQTLTEAQDTIETWASGAINWLYQAGKDVINGLVNGMENVAGGILNTIDSIGTDIVNGVKRFFGINSPSTVMAELGGHIMGGLIQGITSSGNGMGGILDKIFAGALNDPWGWITGHLSSLGDILTKVPGLATALAKKAASGALGGLENLGSDVIKAIFGGGGGGGISGSLMQTIDESLAANGFPMSWASDMATLVSKESGGNPSAVDPVLVDGQHATGIAQMLPSTFAANAMSGFGNIFSALDNLISSERYISREYGSPGNIPGLLSGKYVGYDSGGWLDPGLTVAVNKTGTREPTAVFTPSQWATLQQLASGQSGGSTFLTVQIGDQDITDMIDARVEHHDAVVTRSLARGVKLR